MIQPSAVKISLARTDNQGVTTLDERPSGSPPRPGIAIPDGRPAGWYDDPSQAHNLRYFDGSTWTHHVTHFGPSPCDGCNRRR